MNKNFIYDRAASNWEYKISRNGYRTAYREFLTNNVRASGPVLDVGTGSGTFARVWAEAGGSRDLTVFDPSQEMLNAAQVNLAEINVTPKIERSQVEDFDPQVLYNTILAAHVIEHCVMPDMALRHFANWLEPGGKLFLVVSKPHWCNWLIWLRFRHRWFSASRVLQMADDAGLIPLKTHNFQSGPPSRTSLGYLFTKPQRKLYDCNTCTL
ncbi:MAG: class I SAM-dependent methyltransferase [Rhizobiales bacterium]|nr:class I SAM-dependent methyltransferase [Hyphomicrobiales bacterium]